MDNSIHYFAHFYDRKTNKHLTIGSWNAKKLLSDIIAIDNGTENIANIDSIVKRQISIEIYSIPHDPVKIACIENSLAKYFYPWESEN